jgi:hypothetical protein
MRALLSTSALVRYEVGRPRFIWTECVAGKDYPIRAKYRRISSNSCYIVFISAAYYKSKLSVTSVLIVIHLLISHFKYHQSNIQLKTMELIRIIKI